MRYKPYTLSDTGTSDSFSNINLCTPQMMYMWYPTNCMHVIMNIILQSIKLWHFMVMNNGSRTCTGLILDRKHLSLFDQTLNNLEVTTNPTFLHLVRLITPIIPGHCPSYIPTRFCRVNSLKHFRKGNFIVNDLQICSECPMSNQAWKFINPWTAHLLNV